MTQNICMNVKIRNKFIEIKYSVSNGLVIFITNYWWFRILEILEILEINTYQTNKHNHFKEIRSESPEIINKIEKDYKKYIFCRKENILTSHGSFTKA